MPSPLSRVTIGALCLLIGCGGSAPAAVDPIIIIDEDAEDQPADILDLSALPARCVADASPWRAGQRAFREATSSAKLDALDAQGTRLSAVDFDADGLTDLMIRRGSGEDVWGDGGVRQVWLLKNTGRGVFEDVTQASGIVARRDNDTTKGRPAEVFAWADVNNDGHLDAFTGITNANPSALRASAEIMLGQGDGTFKFAEFIENDARAPQRIITTGGASFTDVDRDGIIDLWVTEGGPAQDKLYRGDGDGVMRDITEAAGLITQPWEDLEVLNAARAHTNAWSAAACDLNNDGLPELLSASYGRAPNHLWRATGSGAEARYENGAIASGYAFDPVQDWSDNESARCHCQLNRQDAGCEGVPAPRLIACQRPDDAFRWRHDTDREPFRLGGNSGTTVCADLNNDGRLDLITAEIVHWDVGQNSDPSQLLYNKGDGSFERAPLAQSGFVKDRGGAVTWDDGDITVAAFDFDHDGRLDLYLGTTDYPGARGRLYHQREDGTFEEVAVTEGIDHRSSHGIAVADFDGDGDLDLVVGHSRNRCASGDHCYPQAHARYFENTIGAQAGGWLQVRLEGAQGANRAAIGARLSVVSGDLTQTREVGGGHGHYGMQDDLVQHVGLGSACEAEVTITWPDQARAQETYTLKAGYRYHITQGEPPRLIDPAP